ncbi:MAG: ribonuclease III [Candidatus Vogelbacteria bacterium CG10_big_fil_rev_8_21_14_0_10_45_14]|uniref:Ribonuclease 3 n=1 Tax=Candidatus Vogelbacteria bacterium CG10_big_fil_rev_8_21_14_0_10_45_14 TaxID=1975042 RepID=A0A2H0RIY0_9BACT|nr:MAG: ribonuclease III [Candidatus Vogelbacteria bacterium CG10_big_fil_rev_8_21_14_0_10_45_14]
MQATKNIKINTMNNLDKFEKKMGLSFNDPNYLRQAFTHRSYLNEHSEWKGNHNERLEFLGDAVLELVATHFLYMQYPTRPEGELTSIRASIVNTTSLSETASALGMNEYLMLSRGEAKDTGRARQYILANTYEAVVGAIYLDKGYDEAKSFIELTLLPKTDNIVEESLWRDAKSYFQEKAQEMEGVTPNYEVVSEEGPDHDKTFTVALYIGKEKVAEGSGHSKQDAETSAARAGLEGKSWN